MKNNQIVIFLALCFVFFAMVMPADDQEKIFNREFRHRDKIFNQELGEHKEIFNKELNARQVILNNKLFAAVKSDDLNGVKHALEQGAQINSSCDTLVSVSDRLYRKIGVTALILAVLIGNYKIVQFLLDQGANANIADKDGWKPIVYAIQSHHNRILKLLLKYDEDINSTISKFVSGAYWAWNPTPAMLAAAKNNAVALAMLINKGVNLNISSVYQGREHTALSIAKDQYRINNALDENKYQRSIIDLLSAFKAKDNYENSNEDETKKILNVNRELEKITKIKSKILTKTLFNYVRKNNKLNKKLNGDAKQKFVDEVQFLFEEGASIPEKLNNEEVQWLDSIIKFINQSRLISNDLNMHENLSMYDATFFPKNSINMQQPVINLVNNLLQGYPLASDVYERRRIQKSINDEYNKAIAAGDIFAAQEFLKFGVSEKIFEQLIAKEIKKALISKDSSTMLRLLNFKEAQKQVMAGLIKELQAEGNLKIPINTIAEFEVSPGKSFISYAIEHRMRPVLYELMDQDFKVNNDVLSQDKVERTVQKLWLNEIIRQIKTDRTRAAIDKEIANMSNTVAKNNRLKDQGSNTLAKDVKRQNEFLQDEIDKLKAIKD